MSLLDERLDQIEKVISQESFLKNKGTSNEVGYYVFDYPANEEMRVREYVEYLVNKINKRKSGFTIVNFDLYDIVIDILQEKGYFEKCFELEKKNGLERVIKAVGSTLRITDEDGLIIRYISERTPPNSVVFLTGVGKCFPILRSHTVLNNLHQVIDHVPVIMFYPGKYDGQELVLFSQIKDDNYYRAFKLVD